MDWKELKQLLASGDHHYDPDRLEASPLGLKRYAAIARDRQMFNKRHLGKFRTADGVAYTFRMPAGYAGSINRSHPVSIEPCLIDYSSPPLYYGEGVVVDATTEGVRPLAAGDTALTDVYGITVRPFPLQQSSGGMTSAAGNATPPAFGIIDVMKFGYIMIQFNASGSAPVKGGAAYIWIAATSGAHIQGLWETASSGSTIEIGTPPRTNYQGGWDSSNVGELIFHD
jgi:hypothetical protein